MKNIARDLEFFLKPSQKKQKLLAVPGPFTQSVSTMLFKHINQVQVAMSPFNVSSRSARYKLADTS